MKQAKEAPQAESETDAVENSVVYETLTVNSRGDLVQQLQIALNEQGYPAGSADGIFGKRTQEAVKDAQKDYGLDETGIADDAFLRILFGR